MDRDSNYLLPVGMGGPNVNLACDQKLSSELKGKYNKTILHLGTFSLHL